MEIRWDAVLWRHRIIIFQDNKLICKKKLPQNLSISTNYWVKVVLDRYIWLNN